MKTANILLFGEILADVFPDRVVPGGAPFNVACHLRGLGRRPLLLSRLGADAIGDRAMALARRVGLDLSGLRVDDAHPSGEVRVSLDGQGGHAFDILPDRAYDHIRAADLRGLLDSLPRQGQPIYFGSLAQRQAESRDALACLLGTPGLGARFFDVNLRAPWSGREQVLDSLARTQWLKVNDGELGILAGWLGWHQVAEGELPARLATRFGLERVLVTRGASGAWLWQDGVLYRHEGGAPPQLVDTVGAGDAFAAVSLLGFMADWPPALLLTRADALARAVCGLRGALPEDGSFYRPFLDAWAPTGDGCEEVT